MKDSLLSNEVVLQHSYTVGQIAKILDISVRKAYQICESNTPFIVKRLGPRCLRINKESFDCWFNDSNT